MESELPVPDPQQLQAEAEKEPSRRGLDDYSQVIRLLKDDKGFSFREIAAWLQERGMKSDHNAVWRAYSKLMPRRNPVAATEQIERLERSGAKEESMPWMDAS
jgi:hypothetical protein